MVFPTIKWTALTEARNEIEEFVAAQNAAASIWLAS
jgi:hypothetical protein